MLWAEASGVDAATVVIAVLALLVSAAALIVSLWDRFFAKADIWPATDWQSTGTARILRVTLVNSGYRKAAVKMIGVRSRATGLAWTGPDIPPHMPVVLDADGAAGPYLIPAFPSAVVELIAQDKDAKLEVVFMEIRRAPRFLGAITKSKIAQPKSFHEVSKMPEGGLPNTGYLITLHLT